MKRFSVKNLVIIGLIGILFSGCASISMHTIKAYDEAKAAVVLAEQAGAKSYANHEFQIARNDLKKSRSAIVAKKDKQALRFALEAGTSADLARKLTMDRIEAKKRSLRSKKERLRKRRPVSRQKTKTILHKISKGENLYLLSAYYYRNAKSWEKIYEANRDVIDNPHLLEVGTTLKIKVRGDWIPEFSLKKWRKAELRSK